MIDEMRIRLSAKLKQERISVDLKKIAMVVRENYPNVILRRLRETKEYPRGFWVTLLEVKPGRIYDALDVLLPAVKRSVIEGNLEPYEAVDILHPVLDKEEVMPIAASLVAVSGDKLDKIIEALPKLKKEFSRIKPRLRHAILIKIKLAPRAAELCDRKEFLSEAIEIISEGYTKEGLETLINTLAGTNDPEGLKLAVDVGKKIKDKRMLLESFEKIITDISGLEGFLDAYGWGPEELINFRISLGRPPKRSRITQFLRDHRELVRKLVKEKSACPRFWLNAARKCDPELIEDALTIPFKATECPVSEAVDCVMSSGDTTLISKLADHYGSIALREAIARELRKEFLELAKTRYPQVIPYIIERLKPEELKDEWMLSRSEEARKLISPHYVSKLAKLIVEAWRGTKEERIVRLLEAMARKAGLEEELPELLAIVYGRITKENVDRFLEFKTSVLLRLFGKVPIDADAAYEIIKKAVNENLYVPLYVLIEASKAGVDDKRLLDLVDRLPIHTGISFNGRLAIKNLDEDARSEYIEKASQFGLDIPDILLEEIASHYASNPRYIGFITRLQRRAEIKTLIKKLGEKLAGQADENLLEFFDSVIRRRRPCPEAYEAIGKIFEDTKNERAINIIRKWSSNALPIEALTALIAMKKINPEVEYEEWFYERFTPTLARASLAPGGYGAIGILTSVFKGVS